jgi:hypothetical protein
MALVRKKIRIWYHYTNVEDIEIEIAERDLLGYKLFKKGNVNDRHTHYEIFIDYIIK